MYHTLAHLYDWPGTLDFADTILARDLALLDAHGIRAGAHILDLACGTGTLAIALAQQGYQVTGIDLSEAMLTQARRKALDVGARIDWRAEDMRTFLLDEPVDAVLCHYDSLNHLSNETELRATFLQVADALRPDGLFVFDLNTLENYRTFWNGRDSYEGPNYRLQTSAYFNEESGKAEVQFHADEYTEEGLMTRQEALQEQYFNETAVEKYLMAAGFYNIRWEPFNPVDDVPADFPLKTLWQAQKRPG